ncbi:hypothetical protein FOZ60_016193 [Perkinsus olseni]|uniref:Uncharacterized protein n=1 Tax=Perkinsus olseni TaxID=32597 RepID=A0A7J6P5S0_PEROL|nr:hypothetical protein FOZ60_016193 [Perkinsus olseni]
MVTYNWNLQWDEAQRSMGGMKSCEAEGSDEISDYSSTSGQADRITRLKLQFDGGQQFLKLSVNIVSMDDGCAYHPSPNSVLKTFVIGLGQAAETRHNLGVLFGLQPIKSLFGLGMPKQIACDLKVAALIVGIRMASCKYPCPFCLYEKGTPCTQGG